MVLLAFAAGGSSSERKRSRPIRAFSATPHDGQRPCRTLAKDVYDIKDNQITGSASLGAVGLN
jgi:hypothetical protein